MAAFVYVCEPLVPVLSAYRTGGWRPFRGEAMGGWGMGAPSGRGDGGRWPRGQWPYGWEAAPRSGAGAAACGGGTNPCARDCPDTTTRVAETSGDRVVIVKDQV